MFSRSLSASRICSRCRQSLYFPSYKNLPNSGILHQRWERRSYGSDSLQDSKQRIEALIAGNKLPSTNPPIGISKDEPRNQALEDDKPVTNDVSAVNANEATPNSVDNVDDIDSSPKRSKPPRPSLLRHHALGVESLGQPVEALVIKNPNQMRFPRKSARVIQYDDQQPVISSQWRDWVPNPDMTDQERLAEACANIEELRPKNSNIVSHHTFNDLATTLVDGFSKQQLASYISLQQHSPAGVSESGSETAYAWMKKRSAWEPALKLDLGGKKPKQQIVSSMMLSVWNLEIQEQIDGLGKTQIWIHTIYYQLLTRYARETLQEIRHDLLDKVNNERVTASPDVYRLNIYTRKSAVPSVLARLNETLRNVQQRIISVEGISKEVLELHPLQELSRATKTVVEHLPETNEVLVSWIAVEEVPGSEQANTKEDSADIVWRLLMCNPIEKLHNSTQVITNDSSGFLMEHFREKRSMSWKDKLLPWYRYVSERKKTPALDSTGTLTEETLPKLVPPDLLNAKVAGPGFATLSATFGHILYQVPKMTKKFDMSGRRVLSPVTPHPAGLTSLTLGDHEDSSTQETSIVLSFACNPTYSNSASKMPEVRLKLPLNDESDLSSFSFPPNSTLHAVVPWLGHDALFPSGNVDVHIAQEHLYPLDINQEALQSFLTHSEFNLLEGRLRTPSNTTFSIPTNSVAESNSASAVGDDWIADVPYVFMGLKIDQTIKIQYKGHTLRYRSVEAGQHGGQRQELSLIAGPLGDGDHTNSVEETESFLQLIADIASGKELSWDKGYLSMEYSNVELDFDMEEDEEDSTSSWEQPDDNDAQQATGASDISLDDTVKVSEEVDTQQLDMDREAQSKRPLIDERTEGTNQPGATNAEDELPTNST